MIKKLSIEDIEYINQILILEEEIFHKAAFKKDYLEILLKGKNSFVYTYIVDSKVCGYLIVLDSIDVYEILSIATAKEYRRQQIAYLLLNEIKNKDIFLEVRKSNLVAINFYKKNNFKEIFIRKNYYSEPTEDAIIMKLEVNNE